MKVMYTDIFEINGLPAEYQKSTQEEILKNADFVSLHIPMPADKKPVITADDLALMKPTAYILNLARGGLIDEDALCDALDAGKLAGAALDVFKEEPAKNQRILTNDKISMDAAKRRRKAKGRVRSTKEKETIQDAKALLMTRNGMVYFTGTFLIRASRVAIIHTGSFIAVSWRWVFTIFYCFRIREFTSIVSEYHQE